MTFKLSKILYLLFIFYLEIISNIYKEVPGATLILGVGMLIVLLFSKILNKNDSQISLPIHYKLLVIFMIYTLLTGFFIAQDTLHLLDSVFTYVQVLALIFFIINVSYTEKSNKFFVNSFIVFVIIYSFIMLLFGHVRVDGRLTLAFGVNPNSSARILLYGLSFVLLSVKTKKIMSLLLSLILSSMFMYLILQTGSRKALYAAIIIFLLWFWLNFKEYFKSYSTLKRIMIFIFGIVGGALLVNVFSNIFINTSMYERLVGKGTSLTDDPTRVGMYNEAFKFFSRNPLFGIGFNQFENLSVYSTYSHSTYGELISTTGLIGTMIYLSSYVLILKDLIKIRFRINDLKIFIANNMYLVLFIIMLVLGTGIIHFYGIIENIILGIIISHIVLNKTKVRGETFGTKKNQDD